MKHRPHLVKRTFKRLALMACTLALGTMGAFGATLQFTPSAPGAYQSSVTDASAVTETFNGFATGALAASGTMANGPFTTTGSPTISNASSNGGAAGSKYAFTGSGTVSISPTNPSKYLGFWWSSFSTGDNDNVQIYGTNGGPETLLATLNASMIYGILGTQSSPKSFTAMDGNIYSGSQYWGGSIGGTTYSANNGLYLYMNVQLNDPTMSFTRIVFGGSYMEFDNVTTSTVWQNSLSTATTPTVAAISPSTGSTSGGTSAIITGTNFLTGATTVTVGGSVCSSPNVTSATSLTCTLPAGTAGTASVVATTSAGSNAANTLYTYIAPPTVTAISPSSGSTTGNTLVTITGSNFLPGATTVTVGGNTCTSPAVISSTSLTCALPSGTVGTASVVATTAGGSNTANTLYTYTQRQTTPVAAAAGGGTVFAQIISGSSGCSIDVNNTTSFIPPTYNSLTPPLGGMKVKVVGCNSGETVTLAVTFSGSLSGLTGMKYGKTPQSPSTPIWYQPNGVSISGNTITYSVTDNGLGDDTFTGADGIINDPIVPVPAVVADSTTSVPTLSEWALLALSCLVALFAVSTLRKKI